MRRAWIWTCVFLMGITTAIASALEVPMDAEVLVTDADSRIVGVGRVVAGVSFELVLVDGFAGPALMVWLSLDGGVGTTEVVVTDGVVWVDGEELTSVLPAAFVDVRVRRATELGASWPPGPRQGPPDEVPGGAVGREPPSGVDPPGPPGTPPGQAEDGPPGQGPPDVPPGRSEDGPPGEGPPEAPPGQAEDGPPGQGPPDEPPGRAEDGPPGQGDVPPGPPEDPPSRRP